jgi:CDP-diacylglycerol--glycerol-3-phosphate 3-phosphatidyltransferase
MRWLRLVPNLISTARLLAVPVLVALAYTRREEPFGALLVAALVSDILDGLIARAFRITSQLGAKLDSAADALLLPTAAYGVWVFHPAVALEHRAAFTLVLALWIGEYLAALLRYGRLSSFHTYGARIAAYALGIFVGGLFVFGYIPWLMWLAVIVAVAASLEEFALLWLLPQWRSNVRGLWWVMREPARSPR